MPTIHHVSSDEFPPDFSHRYVRRVHHRTGLHHRMVEVRLDRGAPLSNATSVGRGLASLLSGGGKGARCSSSSAEYPDAPAAPGAPAAADACACPDTFTLSGAERLPVVKGDDRRTVRTPRHPPSLPRRTAAEKVLFKAHLADEVALTAAGNHCDCGCGLHLHGCYHALVTSLMARRALPDLVKHRLARFTTESRTLWSGRM